MSNDKAASTTQGAVSREAIEDILFKTGRHNQDECSEIADAILKDLPKSKGQQAGPVWGKANELKIAIYDHLLKNSAIIDDPYLHTKGKTYSRKELANELMAETTVAIDIICNLLMLSIEKFIHESTPSKESDAMLWSFSNIRAWDKQKNIVFLYDGTKCATDELYQLFKEKK